MASITADNSTPPAAMSIDVEDWFQVENLKSVIARDTWDDRELRVQRNVGRMLQLMADRSVTGTFFILGWTAEKAPQLIRDIAGAGHEIACHGYGHDLIYTLSEDEFRADVDRCKKLLEDLSGKAVRGYRAITPDPLERGITNFFANIREINYFINSVLQLKPKKAGNAVVRFGVN